MLYLRSLQLTNFKNHREKELQLVPKLNAFCGNNGTGKTNLLDAINYLCLTRSHFTTIETQNIKEGETYFSLQGDFVKDHKPLHIFCGLQQGSRKVVKCNDIPYERLNEHIGLLPLIINTPADSYIISHGSEERRRLIDNTLSQTNSKYLNTLIRYNKLMEQRNAQLKLFHKNNSFDALGLFLYDEQIAPLNTFIYDCRQAFINAFTPYLLSHYNSIARIQEPVAMHYQTEFGAQAYLECAQRNYKRDLALGYSTSGIHRDDLELLYNDHPAKKWASQGQQKTLLLALRLAQVQYMNDQLGVTPILLLDDIFDKLDHDRSSKLIDLLMSDKTGQVIVTHTNSELVKEAACVNLS